MYCPKCRAEFREGFTFCENCGENLVNELPPEPERAERTQSPLVKFAKSVFPIEIWLKRGAIVYVVVGVLSDVAVLFAKTHMPGPFGMAHSGLGWVLVHVVEFCGGVIGSVLWGAFFYSIGVIIEILKEGFSDAQA